MAHIPEWATTGISCVSVSWVAMALVGVHLECNKYKDLAEEDCICKKEKKMT